MIWRWLAVLLAAVATAHGQMIEFAAPVSGHTATLSDGRLGVQWRGDIEALAEYQLQLMAGGDTESQSVGQTFSPYRNSQADVTVYRAKSQPSRARSLFRAVRPPCRYPYR